MRRFSDARFVFATLGCVGCECCDLIAAQFEVSFLGCCRFCCTRFSRPLSVCLSSHHSEGEFSRLVTVNAALLAQQPALRHAVPLAIDRAIQACSSSFVVIVDKILNSPRRSIWSICAGNRRTGRGARSVDLDDHDARACHEGLCHRTERDAHAPRRSSHGNAERC